MDVVGVGHVQLVRIPAEMPRGSWAEWLTPGQLPEAPKWELAGSPGPRVHWAIETGPAGVSAHVLDRVTWQSDVEGAGYDIGIVDDERGPLFAVSLNGRYLHVGDEVSLTPC